MRKFDHPLCGKLVSVGTSHQLITFPIARVARCSSQLELRGPPWGEGIYIRRLLCQQLSFVLRSASWAARVLERAPLHSRSSASWRQQRVASPSTVWTSPKWDFRTFVASLLSFLVRVLPSDDYHTYNKQRTLPSLAVLCDPR